MVKMLGFYVCQFLLLGLILSSTLVENPIVKYMHVATIESSFTEEDPIVTTYDDTLNHELIYLRKTKTGIPLYYYKNVTGDVCFEGKCRLLDLSVYWNITGRYLGFELPQGEFLSKYDHEEFSESEYERLHGLLADYSIPLDAVSFEELIEQPGSEHEEVDGVTGATSKSVADMVVEGAAYTTYKLWNIVNGPTMDYVSELTESALTPDLLYLILQSPDTYDQLWALERIQGSMQLTPDLVASLLDYIGADEFTLALKAIHAIGANHLEDNELQILLFGMYNTLNYSIQKEVVKKLVEAPSLSTEVLIASRSMMHELSGQQLGDILGLYTVHGIADLETCQAVARILANENSFISKKAYDFLVNVESLDEYIVERLKAYKY